MPRTLYAPLYHLFGKETNNETTPTNSLGSADFDVFDGVRGRQPRTDGCPGWGNAETLATAADTGADLRH